VKVLLCSLCWPQNLWFFPTFWVLGSQVCTTTPDFASLYLQNVEKEWSFLFKNEIEARM
jgi:hypothetical protein